MTKAIGHAGLGLLPERQGEIEGLLAAGRYGDGPVPSVVSLANLQQPSVREHLEVTA